MKRRIIDILALVMVALQVYGQTYSYDNLNRLTKVIYGNGITVTYGYDALGNRTSKKVTGGGTVSPIPGDVNGDGVVTAADVTAIYDYLLNGITTNLKYGDVNGDGLITAADVTMIYNILLGT